MNPKAGSSGLAKARSLAACVLLVGSVSGCTAVRHWWNPTEDFVAVGTPTQPFDEAKRQCIEASEFRDMSGTDGTNWNQFWDCMESRGWVQRSSKSDPS